jgi:hypothetical protein
MRIARSPMWWLQFRCRDNKNPLWWYDGGMKEKTSITLSSDVLADLDRETASGASRSAVIERVLREYFKRKVREALNARDLELINAHADYLNREMEDVLRYQAPIDFAEEE